MLAQAEHCVCKIKIRRNKGTVFICVTPTYCYRNFDQEKRQTLREENSEAI